MIQRRRFLLGLGALGSGAALLSLTGCSSGDDDGAISVYSWRQEDSEGYKKIFSTFTEKNEGIAVKFEPYNSTDYDQILQTAIKSGEDLDVIQLRPYASGRDVEDAGILEPLDDLEGMDVFDDTYLDAVKGSDGKVYGVPLALNALISLYNVDLLKKHDIAPPKTWPEFLKACKKLQSAGLTPIAQSGKDAYLLTILFEAVSCAALSDEFTEAALDGSADFTGEEFRGAVQRVLDLQEFMPKDFVGMADDEARAMFAQGEAAFYINGDYRVKPLQDLAPDLNMGYIPSLPDSGDEYRICTAVDGAYAVATDSPHLEDAKTLLTYMTTKEFGNAFAQEFARLGAVPGTASDDAVHKQLSKDIEKHSVVNVMQLIAGGQPDVKAEFENALQGVFSGQIDKDELFATTQKAYKNAQENA